MGKTISLSPDEYTFKGFEEPLLLKQPDYLSRARDDVKTGAVIGGVLGLFDLKNREYSSLDLDELCTVGAGFCLASLLLDIIPTRKKIHMQPQHAVLGYALGRAGLDLAKQLYDIF